MKDTASIEKTATFNITALVKDRERTLSEATRKTCHEFGEKINWEKAADGAIPATLIRHAGALDAVDNMADNLKKIADTYGTASIESTAGRMAEEIHTGTFNADAALKGRIDLTAHTTQSLGNPHAAADIQVFKNGKAVNQVQVKYHGSNSRTTYEISHPKYDGMQKVHPSNQKVADLAKKRGVSGVGTRNYRDTAKNASPSLHREGVKSTPLSVDEGLDISKNSRKVTQSMLKSQMAGAIKAGATTGLVVGGGISLTRNAKKVWDGEKSLRKAALDTTKDTVCSGTDGAAKSAATVVVKEGIKRAGIRGFARNSVPVAVGVTAVELVKDVVRFSTGDIDAGELAVNSGKSIINGAGSCAGAEIGFTVGTMICPGFGSVFGGLVGGIATSVGLSSLWKKKK